MKIEITRALVLVASVTALFAEAAGATTILFNDRTSFLLATGATPVGAIPQNGNTAGF